MKVSWLGVATVTNAIRRRRQQLEENVVDTINETNERIYSESQRRVPVDTGNLKASGRMNPATVNAPVATTTYGGTAAAYALIVHEIHPTQNEYLLGPAREEQDALFGNARDAVNISLK